MPKTIDNLFATILAGGSGQRFWPLSRELSPKQLLSMFGTESLIAQAVHRILPFTDGGSSIVVSTNERLFDELRNHLTAQPDPELHAVRYIQEPLPKNTAPAIALAAATFIEQDPDAIMVVLPSDHLLEDGDVWSDCIAAGARAAAAGYLVTIGITPSRVETGYGYIRAAEAMPDFTVGSCCHCGADAVGPDIVVLEQVVAGQDRHDRFGVLGEEDRSGEGDGGGGVLRERFLDVAHGVQLGVGLGREVVAQLIEEALVGRDDDRRAAVGEGQDAVNGGRDQRLRAEHRQQLLGIEFARQGPESLAAPARENGRSQVRRGHGESLSKSASTIISTSCSKPTVGSQPSTVRALAGSPYSTFTSTGRKKRGSTTTYFL